MEDREKSTLVLYAALDSVDITEPIHPPFRYEEILSAKNEKTRMEKYFVWKLLKKTVDEHLKLDFDNLTFTKTANGQWICPDFHFSLSHTDGAVCVAVSIAEIGVDIEPLRPIRSELATRYLTDREREIYDGLPSDSASRFFIETWVKKEADLKRRGADKLVPAKTESDAIDAELFTVGINGTDYLIAVAADPNEKNEIQFTEEI